MPSYISLCVVIHRNLSHIHYQVAACQPVNECLSVCLCLFLSLSVFIIHHSSTYVQPAATILTFLFHFIDNRSMNAYLIYPLSYLIYFCLSCTHSLVTMFVSIISVLM